MEHGHGDFGELSLASLIGVGEQPEKVRETEAAGCGWHTMEWFLGDGGHQPGH